MRMKVRIIYNIEYSYIRFIFSRTFKLEDIPDDAIVKLLDNIESRL